MHRSLLKQIRSYNDGETDASTLHREYELHFGPSQQFKPIFVKGLIYEDAGIQLANKQQPTQQQPQAAQSPFGLMDDPTEET